MLVVWLAEFPGDKHLVFYGEKLDQSSITKTTKLSRTREDQLSRLANQIENGQIYQQPIKREIWRHEA